MIDAPHRAQIRPPDALYLENGSTYRGQALSLACARMGTALIHAKPYDARTWKTGAILAHST